MRGASLILFLVFTENLLGAAAPGSDIFKVMARAGDRSVTLNWFAQPQREYHVYRSAKEEGPYQRVTTETVEQNGWADLKVENNRDYYYRIEGVNENREGSVFSKTVRARPEEFEDDNAFLEYLQGAAFDYFWFRTNPRNGLVPDRSSVDSHSSIAAIGFGLTAYGIGIDHGWITREEGRERTVVTLRTLMNLRQGPEEEGTAGYKGWFYHFLDMKAGTRVWKCELSSVDTALLLLGVIYAGEYFGQEHAVEAEIRELARALYERVDWDWMLNGGETLTMGWHPETGFLESRWNGYNEASFLYMLALGAEGENAIPESSWKAWTSTYKWTEHYGFEFLEFPPLFGHQYTACWIDLRYVRDDYMRGKGVSYFENSRRATLAQRTYCVATGEEFGYTTNLWGLTACDGPRGYSARGGPPPEHDDGTIAPTAAGGSVVFAPAECVAALRAMYDGYREKIWCAYGFRDGFNLKEDWWGRDVIGIDQGPILLMAENLRTSQVWRVMKGSEELRRGLHRAGFRDVITGK